MSGQPQDILNVYWQNQVTKLETDEHDFKLHQLPLARIKKVMKADPEVKMISAEAPILFAKGCDIFITELTMRAWIHAEENKRRTLQRSDIASALAKSDMFDFLIDIVPREEATSSRRSGAQPGAAQQPPAAVPGGAVAQQTGMHPPPPQMIEYGMAHPQMADPSMYQQQVQQPDPSAYGQPQQQMFDPNAAAAYGYAMPPQQQVDHAHRVDVTEGTLTTVPQMYHPPVPQQRAPDPEGEPDAEGEREDYVG